jgi:hypothetical protein
MLAVGALGALVFSVSGTQSVVAERRAGRRFRHLTLILQRARVMPVAA